MSVIIVQIFLLSLFLINLHLKNHKTEKKRMSPETTNKLFKKFGIIYAKNWEFLEKSFSQKYYKNWIISIPTAELPLNIISAQIIHFIWHPIACAELRMLNYQSMGLAERSFSTRLRKNCSILSCRKNIIQNRKAYGVREGKNTSPYFI